MTARTKEHRFCDNKNEIAFMQLHNFNLLEVTMRIYVVGNIDKRKFTCKFETVFPPAVKDASLCLAK